MVQLTTSVPTYYCSQTNIYSVESENAHLQGEVSMYSSTLDRFGQISKSVII